MGRCRRNTRARTCSCRTGGLPSAPPRADSAYRRLVLAALRNTGRLSDSFRARLLGWSPSGFSVWGWQVAHADESSELERLARCVSRAPLALGKIHLLDKDRVRVDTPPDHKTGATYVEMDVLEFIHRATTQIPDARLHLVRAAASSECAVRGWAFTPCNNHAHRLLDEGQPAASLGCFDRAAMAAAKWDRPSLGRRIDCGRERAFRLLGRHDEAEPLARATLAAVEPDDRVIGLLREELAELHTADRWFRPMEAERLEHLRRRLRQSRDHG